MQPNKISPLNLFSAPLQHLIPIFQRGYVWTLEKQIRTLWSNISDRAGDAERYNILRDAARAQGASHMLKPPRKHFLGAIITSEREAARAGQPESTEVIDGQQRVTTMQLLALAFRDCIAEVPDEYLRNCMHTYTRNEGTFRSPHHRYKVWPTNAGRDELCRIVEACSARELCLAFPIRQSGKGRAKKREPRPLMVEAYLYFYGAISMFLRGQDCSELSPVQDPLEELLIEAGIDSDRTWSDRWIHAIRHDAIPMPPFSELPIQPDRILLLQTTLSEYLQIIELRLDADDDAQVIFETLNALGEKLTAADLVRNFIFLQATRESLSPQELYQRYWQPFDELRAEKSAGTQQKLFWKVPERQGRLTNPRLDTLLYHYVSMRSREDVRLDHVFEAFKTWWDSCKRVLPDELQALQRASELFHALVLPDRTTRLGRFAHNLRALDTSTAMPVVLLLGERLGSESPEFNDCLTYIESYIVRRAICGMTSKAYNRIFPGLVSAIAESVSNPLTALVQYLDGLEDGVTQQWPTDAMFRNAWLSSPTYKVLRPGRTRMILEALELGSRNNRHHEADFLTTASLHIEHVLPQAWQEHWPLPSATPESITLRNTLLHNIGNLTLLTSKLNPSLQNESFQIKRPEITKSLLALNSYFQQQHLIGDAAWNEAAISARAADLFTVAIQVWPYRNS